MINKLFTNNTCLVSRLNSIVFLSVRILLQPNQPMSSSTARSLADLYRVNTMYLEFQSIFDRIIPTATKGKNQMAIYLTNGQKLCFPVCIYSTASWERVERSHFRASIYANVLKTNKGFCIRIRFNSHRTGLHCLHCLQVAITAPERGPITHPAQEGWPHHRGLLPLLLSSEQWCELFYVPQEPSGSAVRRDLHFNLPILGYTPKSWMLFHCFGTPVSGERDVISKRSISDRNNSFKDLKNIKLFISGKSKPKITMINKNNFALAGNRTRASRVAGENSTTEPPVPLHTYTMNLQDCFWNPFGWLNIKKITHKVSRILWRS